MKTKMACHLRNVALLCPQEGFVPHGSLTISDGVITARGAAPLPGETVIDCKGALCLPGLINTHNHSPLMSVRGMVEDLGFAPAYTPGVPQGHWLSAEETHILARLGVMEMLCAGATTIVDYYRMPDALARAADAFGLRAMIGGRVMDADTAALANGQFVHDPKLGEETLGAALDLIDTWDAKGNDRISTILAPHAPDTCSRQMLQSFAELSAKTGKQVHTHLAQSKMEVAQVMARDGLSPAELLEDVGLLSTDLVAAHCIFLEPDDIRRVGQAGVVINHAPIGNAAFGAAAPILALHDAGATITLCTDTKSADMFEAMRTAISSARWRADMAFVLDAKTVFGWGTVDAARALKGHQGTGTLSVGSSADLILLDPNAANLRPVIDGFGIVVHSGSASNVTDVMVAGEWLVRDRRPTRVDMETVIQEAQTVAKGLWQRASA
ncbi:amidohydrolase family protein [Yoonia sediminilitoris]|uniref:5-methylthioadenosine/S-adenosylhomocysteine deaminase n=1 Tax=Yoonia sediminilitoris TaxID=1286148 RepID=A0A2T6KML1_9RHOB|nr:amidohydrolase family protein [Yoonia sediminilitoris]PUB17462.1 5-methylthioadenosine/S-adenosylhomocysteine deaminase [Yoonia sediminilitoris]RCW97757.1 5-methylthioadenosine/S-adenosylhomocysteine deaminase [Yoonia sediminilitoris]